MNSADKAVLKEYKAEIEKALEGMAAARSLKITVGSGKCDDKEVSFKVKLKIEIFTTCGGMGGRYEKK